MDIPVIEPVWLIAGAIIYGIVALLRKYTKLKVAPRYIKQSIPLMFAIITVIVLPFLAGQPLAAIGVLITQVINVWGSATLTYAVIKTVLEQFFPVPKANANPAKPDLQKALAAEVKRVLKIDPLKLSGVTATSTANEILKARVGTVRKRLGDQGFKVTKAIETLIEAALKS